MNDSQIKSIIEYKDLDAEFFTFQMSDCDESMDEELRLNEFFENVILNDVDEDEEKILVLMEHTGDEYSECESHIELDRYRVYTDSEANNALDEALDRYCEEIILSQIPDYLHEYFDVEEWKSDNNSDRGFYLGQSDGDEHEEAINGNTYYIYKIWYGIISTPKRV